MRRPHRKPKACARRSPHKMVSIDWPLPAADSEASRCTLACEQALLIGLACVVGARKNGRALVRSFLCPQLPSACYASYIWASEAIRAKTRERAAKSPPPRFLVSSRSLLARLLFTISPKWRACLKASRTRVKPSGTQGTEQCVNTSGGRSTSIGTNNFF